MPTASYTTFGSGCAGSNGVPALQPQNVPALGSAFRLDVVNLPAGGGVAVLVLGLSNSSWNSLPLPLDLTIIGLPGCTALCSVDFTTLLFHASGLATWTLPVPNLPTLGGMQFFNQAVSLDAAAPRPVGAALSNGGHGVIR